MYENSNSMAILPLILIPEFDLQYDFTIQHTMKNNCSAVLIKMFKKYLNLFKRSTISFFFLMHVYVDVDLVHFMDGLVNWA